MKKFGLIGGTSWHSTVEYYAAINKLINDHHGDNTNPPLRIVSLNQKQIHDFQRADDWGAIAETFVSAGLELQGLGVEGVSLCANTPHKIFDSLRDALSVPILHIADAIGSSLQHSGWNTVGLLGTRFTMAQDFIKGRLREKYQITTVVPTPTEQDEIQKLIYEELSVGVFDDGTKDFFLRIVESLQTAGAQAVILGCTEIPLLLKDTASPVPCLDSLECHCEAIVRYILGDDGFRARAT